MASVKSRCVLILLLLAATRPALALNGYEFLANWSDLPRCKAGVRAGLASSYDRAGGNADYNQYLWPVGLQTTDGPTVVADLTGPGIITRFWMPHATANVGFSIHVIVDGVVRIDTNSNDLLDGRVAYMTSPLVQTLLGGQVSYEPIAFQQSLRIESNNFGSGGWAATHHYYQWNYYEMPAGAVVRPYDGTLTPEQLQARQVVTTMIGNVGSNPAGPAGDAICLSTPATVIPGGASVILANLNGFGTIRQLSLKMPVGATDAQLDGLVLLAAFDDVAGYAIDVPVSHFFGAGHGRVAYRSLPLGTDSPDGYYCYWPMPYRQSAVVELFNNTDVPISIDSAKVEYQLAEPPASAGYLHAVYAQEVTTAGQTHHLLLDTRGRGNYVGNLLYVEKPGDSRGILEGDDVVTVEPDTLRQAIFNGTGMEDAYNGGYYYNHVLEQTNDGDVADPRYGIGPYHGLLYMDFFNLPGFVRTRVDQYRWLIGDSVPFTDGINVRIENYGNSAGVLFGSTAFCYMLPTLTGDINRDGFVSVGDLQRLVMSWGQQRGDQSYNADADLNGDGYTNVGDLQVLVSNWGRS